MKGQTAIEYLMTYGWAILIILIVAGVLAYYGIFAPSGFLGPSARGFGQVQVLSPFGMGSDGILSMNVENRAGDTINITAVYGIMDNTAEKVTLSPQSQLSAGQKKVISVPFINAAFKKSTGSTFTLTTTIEYNYTGTLFNSTGTVSGTVS